MRWWLLIAFGWGCGDKETDSGDAHGTTGPTFYQDVLPIVGENCQQCHNSTDPMGAAFPLETYAQVNSLAEIMVRKMQPEGDTVDPFFMPPFPARTTDECLPPLPYHGNYHVSVAELTVFETWIDVGKPEGDADKPATYEVPTTVGLEGELQTLTFKGEYTLSDPATGTQDDYRCFALQAEDGRFEVDDDVWVNGFEFQPGNPKVAHHMLLYTVPDLEAHLETGLATDEDNASWACSGGVSPTDHAHALPGSNMIWAWVPGAMPLDLQENMGMQIAAGEGMVLQMHYNTLTVSAGDDLTDISRLQLRPMAEVPQREAKVTLFGVVSEGQSDIVEDPPFDVPVGSTAHEESYAETMSFNEDSVEVRVWGMTPHMHLAGTDIKISRTRAGGEEECWNHVPKWDFNYQQMYVFDGTFGELPHLNDGDTVRVRCTYDNSEDNVILSNYLGGPVEPSVRLGEGTENEMCVVALGVACEGRCNF